MRWVFFALFFVTWLIGGNLVIARHYRRVGVPTGYWTRFPWKGMNVRERFALLAVAALALIFGVISLWNME